MCGIAASFNERDEKVVSGMMSKMSHRGPDGSGLYRIGDTFLGHVRLAILDLKGGTQPLWNEQYELAVTFNGEIYNHAELRKSLENRHQFKSRSDTEVLVHGFEEDGADLLPKLDGMFAIAWAGPQGILVARDPFGIKPLYFGRKGTTWLVGSELKSFPPMDSLTSLPAGHVWTPGTVPWKFSLPFPPEPFLVIPRVSEILKEVRRRLEQAVVKRLMSDVPVGVYLSGGLDSTVVATLMKPHVTQLHSFTAGIQGAPDLEAARSAAKTLGTHHHELIYTEEDVRRALPEVIRALESFDAPLVRSAVPMYFVSKLASQHVKVVLSGEGADELFAGYSYLEQLGGGPRLKKELVAITDLLQNTNLQRADRMSMAHGLEARVPFLDLAFARYVSRIPIELIEPRSGRPGKWLLREAFRELVPSEFLDRKKMKFSEGAGSSNAVQDWASKTISDYEYEKEKEIGPGFSLRSPEELFYYRIWREVMPSHLPHTLVMRTNDRSAAVFGN